MAHRYLLSLAALLLVPSALHAQVPPESTPPVLTIDAGADQQTIVDKALPFEITVTTLPEGDQIEEVLWSFGDGIQTTGDKVSHAYDRAGTYTVRVRLTSTSGSTEDTLMVTVLSRVLVLLTDSTPSDEQLAAFTQQAAAEGLHLTILRANNSGSVALSEEELTQALVSAQEDVRQADIIAAWTAGSVGANTLSRFAQQVRQASDAALTTLGLETKGLFILSTTPLSVLAPTAQASFNQLRPAYVLLTKPDVLPLLFTTTSAEDARTVTINSPFDYRLLGEFSNRAISDLGLTNFMSFGINYLINGGIPINNIVLVLMIPVIASILAFARQVIGLKAFGLITPAMTTLALLVLGLIPGLIVFIVVLLSGTLTRLLMRRWHLLYLPRMALILTNASLAILVVMGLSVALRAPTTVAFSIFPVLLLIILAEEFIAVQFSRGLQTALRITAWTLSLAVACYFMVNWQLLRVALLSYPELVLLAIPINIILGRFTGLRLVEYLRFRHLLRFTKT